MELLLHTYTSQLTAEPSSEITLGGNEKAPPGKKFLHAERRALWYELAEVKTNPRERYTNPCITQSKPC